MFVKGVSSTDLGIPGLPNDLKMNEKVTEEERAIGDELKAVIHNNIAGSRLLNFPAWFSLIKAFSIFKLA